MRGIDMTPEQLDAADSFMNSHRTGICVEIAPTLPRDQMVSIVWGDLVRLVAWYGAIRYEAGAAGRNSVETPGPCGAKDRTTVLPEVGEMELELTFGVEGRPDYFFARQTMSDQATPEQIKAAWEGINRAADKWSEITKGVKA